jgi:Fanconi anemia group M protein
MDDATEQGFSIVVDSRERNLPLIARLEELGGNVRFDTITSGDYVVSGRIGVERKTMQDFEKSLIDGRLFNQALSLCNNYSIPILIIEGLDTELRLGRKVFLGAMAALSVDFGIRILKSYDEIETAELISLIAYRETKGAAPEPSPKHGVKALTPAQFQAHVIGNLPGVGPKLSKSLLSHFGSIKEIANAEVGDLMEVEKIGKKKAEIIHRIINAKYASDP